MNDEQELNTNGRDGEAVAAQGELAECSAQPPKPSIGTATPHANMIRGYQVHRFAARFEMFSEPELTWLAEDIKANGLQQEIVLYDGAVLDGRNRLEACGRAQVEPRFQELSSVDLDEGEALKLVLSRNVVRRHLEVGQRAAIGASFATLGRGRPSKPANSPDFPLTHAEAAKMMNVSERSIRDAIFVLERAPELETKLRRGTVTLHEAVKHARNRARAGFAASSETASLRRPAPPARAASQTPRPEPEPVNPCTRVRLAITGFPVDTASTEDALNAGVAAADFLGKLAHKLGGEQVAALRERAFGAGWIRPHQGVQEKTTKPAVPWLQAPRG